jgi:hypothetical protein
VATSSSGRRVELLGVAPASSTWGGAGVASVHELLLTLNPAALSLTWRIESAAALYSSTDRPLLLSTREPSPADKMDLAPC